MLREADCSPDEAEAIYRLTSLCTFEDRFVIPAMHREEAMRCSTTPSDTSKAWASAHVRTKEGVVSAVLYDQLGALLRYPDAAYLADVDTCGHTLAAEEPDVAARSSGLPRECARCR